MLAENLNQETRRFLEINSTEDDRLELPPQFQGLCIRPNIPAGIPHESVSEEIKKMMRFTVCLPTAPNEQEGG